MLEKEDFDIYSREASDGGTDWRTIVGSVALGLLLITLCSPLLIVAVKWLVG